MSHIVVIGAGQAGASLVGKLRTEGFEGDITLLGAEDGPPYQRPALSKAYLLGEMERERLFLRPRDWYEGNDITLRTGTRAVSVDSQARTVTLEGDEVLTYDQLAFTTGSHPRTLPATIGGELDGVFTVRNLADADALKSEFLTGRHLLVIGGGSIGLEAAAVASKMGLHVTLVEMETRILQRVAAPETSDYFRTLHDSHNVDIREGVRLDRLIGEAHITGAILSDGSQIDVDFAIVGVGIYPATALAQSAGVACDNGIVTNAYGKTSNPHIWAAGDCATSDWHGQKIRLESVGNAIDQAEIIACNMLGANQIYVPKPWFWSDQFDVKLQIAGLNIGYTQIITRKNGDAQSHWYYREDTLIAVDAMNDPRSYMIGKRLIEAGKSPAPSVIADLNTDMKALLKQ